MLPLASPLYILITLACVITFWVLANNLCNLEDQSSFDNTNFLCFTLKFAMGLLNTPII